MSQHITNLRYALLTGLILLSAACSATQTSSATGAVSPAPAASAIPPAASAQNAESNVPRVSVDELKQLLADKKAVVVDVRSIDAYNIGHIKGSISLPLDKIQAGDHKSLPRDKRIITYCSCPAENSSSVAAVALEKAGFKDAGVLVGGTAAWEKSGGEMGKASIKAKP